MNILPVIIFGQKLAVKASMKISAIVLSKYPTFEVVFFARKMSIFALKSTFLGQNRPNIYM